MSGNEASQAGKADDAEVEEFFRLLALYASGTSYTDENWARIVLLARRLRQRFQRFTLESAEAANQHDDKRTAIAAIAGRDFVALLDQLLEAAQDAGMSP